MKIYKDYDFNDLMDACWSGAIDTLVTVQENDKEEELMSLLSMDCFSDTPDLTEVNDLLWFDGLRMNGFLKCWELIQIPMMMKKKKRMKMMIKKNADKINALCKETVKITDILNKQDISEELRNKLYNKREKLFKEIKKYVKKER